MKFVVEKCPTEENPFNYRYFMSDDPRYLENNDPNIVIFNTEEDSFYYLIGFTQWVIKILESIDLFYSLKPDFEESYETIKNKLLKCMDNKIYYLIQ